MVAWVNGNATATSRCVVRDDPRIKPASRHRQSFAQLEPELLRQQAHDLDQLIGLDLPGLDPRR